MLLEYWILVHCRFNNFFYVYCKGKTPLLFFCSFCCCLLKEGWTLKDVQQFAIWGLVAYKLIGYKKPRVSKILSTKVYTLSPFYFPSLQKQSPLLFYKKVVLKYFAIITEKHLFWGLFLIKLQAFSPATLLKRNSNTAAFLSVFQNFKEHLFRRTSANGCSCSLLEVDYFAIYCTHSTLIHFTVYVNLYRRWAALYIFIYMWIYTDDEQLCIFLFAIAPWQEIR